MTYLLDFQGFLSYNFALSYQYMRLSVDEIEEILLIRVSYMVSCNLRILFVKVEYLIEMNCIIWVVRTLESSSNLLCLFVKRKALQLSELF